MGSWDGCQVTIYSYAGMTYRDERSTHPRPASTSQTDRLEERDERRGNKVILHALLLA